MESLPEPDSAAVKLVSVPAETVAVRCPWCTRYTAGGLSLLVRLRDRPVNPHLVAQPSMSGLLAMTLDQGEVTLRKSRHIGVCRDEPVGYHGVTTGLELYRLAYNTLTQTDLADIDLATDFLGGQLRAPILVGAMTGGADLSGNPNRDRSPDHLRQALIGHLMLTMAN